MYFKKNAYFIQKMYTKMAPVIKSRSLETGSGSKSGKQPDHVGEGALTPRGG